MEDGLTKYLVKVPETCVGRVAGELSRRGAWLDRLSNDAGVVTIEARASDDEMDSFENWLDKVTGGHGQLTRDS